MTLASSDKSNEFDALARLEICIGKVFSFDNPAVYLGCDGRGLDIHFPQQLAERAGQLVIRKPLLFAVYY
jgi:hypothetical protein